MIPLSRPDLTTEEIEAVLAVVRTPFLAMGPRVEEFEAAFASLLGVRHAVAVANGTCGLHLAVRALGIRPGCEVITTPFSFVATANVVLFEHATPVFVDIDPQTLNITPEGVEATIAREYRREGGRLVRRTTGAPLVGILPVSVFGHPVDMDGLVGIARANGLWIAHDTCEALGSTYYSRVRDGWVNEAVLADAAVFAFYPNKQITTGEGGMVVTDDEEVATYCRMARNQGRRPGAEWLEHEIMGFNYRMDELSAALGLAQLRRLPELLARRAQVARWYDQALEGLDGVQCPRPASWARVAWFVYVVRLHPGVDRDAVIRHLAQRGVSARPYFPAIHLQPYFRARGFHPGQFPVAEDAARRTVALPYYNTLSETEVHQVVEALREAIRVHANV
jgi:perosamine synthetase